MKRFLVYGYVQGVGFRYFTWQQAVRIGVTGFVRNLANGSVEVVAVGSYMQIQHLANWLQHGPHTAQVEQVLEEDYLGEKEFSEFQVLH